MDWVEISQEEVACLEGQKVEGVLEGGRVAGGNSYCGLVLVVFLVQEVEGGVVEQPVESVETVVVGHRAFLLNAAIDAPDLGLFSSRNDGLGLFHITAAQHRDLWDRYLAFNPDLASRIRGLASQRAFLRDPDSELQTNLSYCTAIAWLMHHRAGGDIEEPAELPVFSA